MKQKNRVHFIGCNPYAAPVQPKKKASLVVFGIILALLAKLPIKPD